MIGEVLRHALGVLLLLAACLAVAVVLSTIFPSLGEGADAWDGISLTGRRRRP